jgi:hypothetical protein
LDALHEVNKENRMRAQRPLPGAIDHIHVVCQPRVAEANDAGADGKLNRSGV